MAQALPTTATQPITTNSSSTGPGYIPAPGYTPAPGSVATSPMVSPTLPSSTPAPTTPATPPSTDVNGNPVKTPAQIQAEADGMANAPLDSGVGTRMSATIESDFQKMLDKVGAPPAAPDSNATQTTLNATPGGVNDLTGQLNDAQTQYTQLENNLQQEQAGEASKPGVVATIINGRMKMLSAEQSKALNDAKANISSLTTQLKNSQAAVSTFMKNQQTDYGNALKLYEDSYSKAITVYNDEQSQLDKVGTAAKANAQVIINSYKGSSVGASSITEDQKTQWGQLELQAGMPTGTIEAAVKAELNVQKFVKGGDGNMYVTGTDNSGNPFTAKITGSYGAGSGIPKPNSATTIGGTPLSKIQYAKLNSVGVDSTLANKLTAAIIKGVSLDQIRAALTADGNDPKVLDEYDAAVGIKTILKNAPKSTATQSFN